jgi:hypothetical protein
MMNVMRLCLALTALPLTASSGLANDVLGTWLCDNARVRVKVEPGGDAIYGSLD